MRIDRRRSRHVRLRHTGRTGADSSPLEVVGREATGLSSGVTGRRGGRIVDGRRPRRPDAETPVGRQEEEASAGVVVRCVTTMPPEAENSLRDRFEFD
jgi:hypothetical protein